MNFWFSFSCPKQTRTANLTWFRCCDNFIFSRLNWFPSLRFCNFKNNGHGKHAIKILVIEFAARCCICHVEIKIQNQRLSNSAVVLFSAQRSLKKSWRVDICPIGRTHLQSDFSSPCTDFVLVFLDKHSTSTQVRSIVWSLGPCFHWRTAIQMYENWTIDSNTRRNGNSVLSHVFQHSRRQSQALTETSVLELGPPWIGAESSITGTVAFFSAKSGTGNVLSRFCDLRFRLRFHYILYVVFLPRLPSALSRKIFTCFVVSSSIGSTFRRRGFQKVFPPIPQHFDVPQGRDHLDFFRNKCPVHFNLKFHFSFAFVNLQTFVIFRMEFHLSVNPCSTFFCVRFWCLPMDSNFRKRKATNRHIIFPRICPCDVASTWRQRQIENLTSWGSCRFCSFCSSFDDIPRETTMSVQTVNIASILFIGFRFCTDVKKSINDHDESATVPRNAQTCRFECVQLATALVFACQE